MRGSLSIPILIHPSDVVAVSPLTHNGESLSPNPKKRVLVTSPSKAPLHFLPIVITI
jgi:hypothetical protein